MVDVLHHEFLESARTMTGVRLSEYVAASRSASSRRAKATREARPDTTPRTDPCTLPRIGPLRWIPRGLLVGLHIVIEPLFPRTP
jgi:hypothetical protein